MAGKWRFNETSEQVTLAFPKVITAPQLTLLLRFNLTLNEGLSGFYRSTYQGKIPYLSPACSTTLLVCGTGYFAAKGALLLCGLSNSIPASLTFCAACS